MFFRRKLWDKLIVEIYLLNLSYKDRRIFIDRKSKIIYHEKNFNRFFFAKSTNENEIIFCEDKDHKKYDNIFPRCIYGKKFTEIAFLSYKFIS